MKKKEFQVLLFSILECIKDVPENADVTIQYFDSNTSETPKCTIEDFLTDIRYDDQHDMSSAPSDCEKLKVYIFDND